MTSKHLQLAICIFCLLAPALHAQTTYVDATASNLTRVDGNPLTTSSTANLYTDSNWTLRTGMASNATVYEGGGGESVPVLKQTVTGVTPGTYEVFAYFWVAGSSVRWQINAGFSSSSLSLYYGYGQQSAGTLVASPTGSTAYAGGFTHATAPTTFAEADRTLVRASLGTTVVGASGTTEVFVATGPLVTNGVTGPTNTRTWFDGIGYAVPTPLPGNAVEIAPDGAWTWFNDERSIFHQGSLFCGYVKADGQYGITRRDLTTGTNYHMIISTAASQQKDDHNNPSITVLPDGKLMALYSKHLGGSQFYQRTSLVNVPSSAADWGNEIVRTTPANNTYANTYRLTGELNAIYNFHRCINFNPTVTISTDNGATWGTSRQMVAVGSNNIRPYPRYISNGVDRIDLIYTDGHPRDVNNSVYHMYYKGGNLYKTDGALIDSLDNIPLDHQGGERGSVLYQYSDEAWGANQGPDDWIPTGRGWTWDVAYVPNGAPVAVFQVQVGTDATWSGSRIYYYYARWTGTQWQRRFIAQGGRGIYAAESDYGGGMCLDPNDPRVVYISTNAAEPFNLSSINNVTLRANARYEIYRGFTADGGLSFTWTPITENSTADNLRPIVPLNHPHTRDLIWFYGTYTTYSNYSARVLASFGQAAQTFSKWTAENGIVGASQTDDSDDDGDTNLLEYGTGGKPAVAEPRSLPAYSATGFSFRIFPQRTDIEWLVQKSDDLKTWQEIATFRAGGLPASVTSGYQTTSSAEPNPLVDISLAPGSGVTKAFFRLLVRKAQ